MKRQKRALIFLAFSVVFIILAGILPGLLGFNYCQLSYFQALQAREIFETEAEGFSTIQDGDIARARNMALEDALRNAVEKAVGVHLDSETKTRNYELIEDNIYMKSQGYVSGYDKIESKMEGDQFRVKVRAEVKEGLLEDDLEALELTIHRAGDPRVMVIVEEEHGWGKVDSPAAEIAILDQLQEVNFRTVDPDTIDEIRDKEAVRGALKGNEEAYKQLEAEFDVDVMVLGNALSVKAEEKEGFIINNANLDIRVVEADTGEIITTERVEENAMHVTKETASRQALAAAGEKAGNILASEIPREIGDTERSVQLHIEGITFDDFGSLLQEMEDFHLVDAVYEREFIEGEFARIDVDTQLSPFDLASEIESWEIGTLEVAGISGSKIEMSGN